MRYTSLRSFHAVASAGGFNAAADELNISQPTLTAQVATLEAEYGIELFMRQGYAGTGLKQLAAASEAPIGSLYPRAALAVCSSFATVVLMLVGQPVHQWLGQRGLLAFAALLAAGAIAFAWRARREPSA